MASGRPCAACRYLRKKCSDNCLFAPYFRGDKIMFDQFSSIHKIFGHSHFAKRLQKLPVDQRHDAVASMLYDAEAWLRDPVHGCISDIQALQQENENLKQQLLLSRAQLAENENLKKQLVLSRAQLAENHILRQQLAITRAQVAECWSLLERSRNVQVADYTNDNQSKVPSSIPSGYQHNQPYSINNCAVQPVAAAAEEGGPSCFPMYMQRGHVSNQISNVSSVEQRDAEIDLGAFKSGRDVWNRLSRASPTFIIPPN